MKGYKTFAIIFVCLFVMYLIAEVNKPIQLNWQVTLSKGDKNPYGGFVLYQQLNDLFPKASIASFQLPVYNQLHNSNSINTAYLLMAKSVNLTNNDWQQMKTYVFNGNYVLASAVNFNKLFSDSLQFKIKRRISLAKEDSTSINFVHPNLKQQPSFKFKRQTIDEYFSKIDTTKALILGTNNQGFPNYISISYGRGAFLIHTNPLVFSNYFMLSDSNAQYTAKTLSYLPQNLNAIYWDEYYKLGQQGAATPLRYFLSNKFLAWALRLTIGGLLLYLFFEAKRRQRIIPVITPLRNTTVDFVKTVSNVYYNQKDNASIADKKIKYFLEFIRHRFYLPTNDMGEDFVDLLSKKSGIDRQQITSTFLLINKVNSGYIVSDSLLLTLNERIDQFYKQAKSWK